MTFTHEIRPDIDDGIDRKVLARLRKRFLAINQGRLERATAALSSRQQLVLRLLPLLLVIAIAFGTINVVGGFLVTDRMLEMFKAKDPKKAAQQAEQSEDAS